jgi:hypothetical protein
MYELAYRMCELACQMYAFREEHHRCDVLDDHYLLDDYYVPDDPMDDALVVLFGLVVLFVQLDDALVVHCALLQTLLRGSSAYRPC